MTPQEIGFVFNQLVERRVLYSFKLAGRNRAQQEQEAVRIIEDNRDCAADLDEFLSTQGLRIEVQEAMALRFDTPGRIYVAVRDPLLSAPLHIAGADAMREFSDGRKSESRAELAAWGGCLLLVLLKILYTDERRAIEAVSGYKDAFVDDEQFSGEVSAFVETLRATAPADDPQAQLVHAALTKEGGTALETRCKTFLRAMCRMGVLEERPQTVRAENRVEILYGQSLWSAVDVARNFKRNAGALLGDLTATVVATLVTEEMIGEDVGTTSADEPMEAP